MPWTKYSPWENVESCSREFVVDWIYASMPAEEDLYLSGSEDFQEISVGTDPKKGVPTIEGKRPVPRWEAIRLKGELSFPGLIIGYHAYVSNIPGFAESSSCFTILPPRQSAGSFIHLLLRYIDLHKACIPRDVSHILTTSRPHNFTSTLLQLHAVSYIITTPFRTISTQLHITSHSHHFTSTSFHISRPQHAPHIH